MMIASTEADGDVIYDFENYPSFPIIPLWANSEHQSTLVGIREQIDCYDLIKSGFANTVDEASIVYWTLQNAGGMSEVDLAKFITRMKTLHAVVLDGGETAQSHTLDAPVEGRKALLALIDADLYRDAMALNIDMLLSGSGRSDQVKAAYEALNAKCDEFEYQLLDFIQGILDVAGIEDTPTFTRSLILNQQESIGIIIQASQFLSSDYVTRKILTILGDGDKADDILADIDAEELARFMAQQAQEIKESEKLEEPIEE